MEGERRRGRGRKQWVRHSPDIDREGDLDSRTRCYCIIRVMVGRLGFLENKNSEGYVALEAVYALSAMHTHGDDSVHGRFKLADLMVTT